MYFRLEILSVSTSTSISPIPPFSPTPPDSPVRKTPVSADSPLLSKVQIRPFYQRYIFTPSIKGTIHPFYQRYRFTPSSKVQIQFDYFPRVPGLLSNKSRGIYDNPKNALCLLRKRNDRLNCKETHQTLNPEELLSALDLVNWKKFPIYGNLILGQISEWVFQWVGRSRVDV